MHENDYTTDESALDIASPRLDQFLVSAEARQLDPSERLRRLRAIFGKDEARVRALEELHPYRIMALWRISRYVLEAKGRLSPDERLEDATGAQPSPWEAPTRPVGQDAPRRGTGSLLAMHYEGEGLPLLCPPGPPHGPQETVQRWCDATGVAAGLLGIAESEQGQMGLEGLLDPTLAPRCCPTVDQVLAFEEYLIGEALELLVQHGEPAAMKHYRERYYLTRKEAVTVIRMARDLLRQELDAPLEENRAVAIAMLKRFIEDVAQTPNMRDRLAAIKELVRVQGIIREAPDNDMKDLLNVIRNVSGKREQKELGGGRVVDALPAHEMSEREGMGDISDVAFEVYPEEEDREALDSYDRENR